MNTETEKLSLEQVGVIAADAFRSQAPASKEVGSSANRPPAAGRGRKAGTPNKITADLRAMVLGALEDAGGREYLLRQARKRNPVAFMALVGKCLPKNINVSADMSLADMVLGSFPPAPATEEA